jgi:hypothetical protein
VRITRPPEFIFTDYNGWCRLIFGQEPEAEVFRSASKTYTYFFFLFIEFLTTRAGGLGINLTSADVVLYDRDWYVFS